MYCPNCGKQNVDDAKFCTGCGAALAPKTAAETQAQKSYFADQTKEPEAPKAKSAVDHSDKSSTLGIVALIMAFLIPIVGLILGIIDYNAKDGYNKQMAKWAMIAAGIVFVVRIIAQAILNAYFTNVFTNLFMDFFRFYM